MDNKIKLHVTFSGEEDGIQGEWLWARRISEGCAKLSNIPLCAELGQGDLVSYDEEMEILEVLEKATNTFHLWYKWHKDEDKTEREFREIREYLLAHDIHVEGLVIGLIAISVALGIEESELHGIIEGCPHRLSFEPPGGDNGICPEQQGDN